MTYYSEIEERENKAFVWGFFWGIAAVAIVTVGIWLVGPLELRWVP